MTKATQKDAKRLRKSVKRRRGYAESLRATAAQIKRASQVDGSDDDARFAERLDQLADQELAAAREEEAQAKEIEGQRTSAMSSIFGGFSSQEQRERSDRAMAAIAGRMAVDRVAHLVSHHGLPGGGGNDADMAQVERKLGLTEQVNPKGKQRLQLGARINLAETATFGAPRF